MKKGFVSLLMLGLCLATAGESRAWLPDFSAQCKRDEQLRDNYLAAERLAVENTLAEMNKRGINIIPTPKNLSFLGKDMVVAVNDLAAKAVIFADQSAAVAAGIIGKELGAAVKISDLKAYNPTANISILLLRQDTDAGHPLLPTNIPNFCQGYSISTRDTNGMRTYVLAGKDHTGLLYAAVTFSKLIIAREGLVTFPGTVVSDWPDIRYRKGGGLLYEYWKRFDAKNPESGKRFIDWLLAQKINMTEANCGNGDRLYFPYEEEGKKWLREVCTYAQARDIQVMLPTFTAVGDRLSDKDDAAFKDWACVEHLGFYYCWSNDDLIRKRAQRMVQHLKETGLSAIFIHSVDTGNSKWQDRCPKCRERFGDDRFSGDANVFTLYRDEIRKSFPEMPVAIVPRPYAHSVDDIYNIETGEMKSKDDLKRFAKMLPGDIYICHRGETSRANNLSWVHTFKQPMFSCVMAWYSYPTLEGRDFTPIYRYFRSYNYPLSDEIADLGVAGSDSRSKIQCLGLAEFTWNLNAPGSAEYSMTPPKYPEYPDIWDPFGGNLSKNKELQALVKRSCDDLFGKIYSQYFYNKYLLFIDWCYVFDHDETIYALRNGYMTSGKGPMADIGDKEDIAFMQRIHDNSKAIIKDMETVKQKTADAAITCAANRGLQSCYQIRAAAHTYTLALLADQASKDGDHVQADKLINAALAAYDDELKQVQSDWLVIQGGPNEVGGKVPAVAEAEAQLKKHKNILDMLKVKIQSREMIAKRKKNSGTEKKEAPRENKPIKAAVFSPDLKGGLTYGRMGLVNLLKGINDISVEEIDNLSPETMEKYDCVIFPDCKSLGSANVSVPDIRAYVVDHGGGMYFEHDSCGFNRFPLKGSMFPEIAHVADRIGEPPTSTKYKADERIFKIAKQHPVTDDNLVGATFKQVYFDHLQLINETGDTLVADSYGKSVVVAGLAGKGRVVFNGGLALNVVEDKELDKPLATVEGKIIVNSVRWLAKDKKGTELIMADLQKTDKTLTDRQASVVTFKPQIIPCKPLHDVVISAQCFNARDMRTISPRTEIAKVDAITEKWEAEGNVIINADSYPQITVVMEMASKEGRGRAATVVDNK